MIELRIDPSDGAPPSEQVRAQVLAAVAEGRLRPGDRLPTVRGLADELGIAVNTVAKAYRDLEARGVVEGRGRAGTFVSADDAGHAARAAAHDYLARARALGLTPAQAVEEVRRLAE